MRLPNERGRGGAEAVNHYTFAVYREMLLQICSNYGSLPDPRSLTMAEIRFFYDGLRDFLKKATAE